MPCGYQLVPALKPDWCAGQKPDEPLPVPPATLLCQTGTEISYYGSAAEIERAWQLFIPAGAVTEARILEGRVSGHNVPYGGPAAFFGFFDNPAALIYECRKIAAARGVYFLPNAVHPELQARAFNRFKRGTQRDPIRHPEGSAGNADIITRRFVLLDVDAPSPPGTAATEEERRKCWELLTEILRWLDERQFPRGIIVSSGNGFQVAFPASLAAADGGFCQEFAASLAKRFDGDGSRGHVDQACHNAARIWRLPGLPNCKGDNCFSLDRIHRMAHLIAVPKVEGAAE